MTRRLALVVVVVGLLAGAGRARALGPLDTIAADAPAAARVDTGFEDGVVGWLGYGRRLPALGGHAFALEARVGLPLVAVDLGDVAGRAGVQLEVAASGRFHLRNQLDLDLRHVDNRTFAGFGVGVRDTLSFGWYARRGFAGVDVGWEQGLATHISHSDAYRANYPDAEDGWIAAPIGRFHGALYGGVAATRRLCLALRAGIDVDRTGRPGYVPVVVVLAAAWSF